MERTHAVALLDRLHEAQNRFYAGGDDAALIELLAADIAWTVPGDNAIAGWPPRPRGGVRVLPPATRPGWRQLAHAPQGPRLTPCVRSRQRLARHATTGVVAVAAVIPVTKATLVEGRNARRSTSPVAGSVSRSSR